MTIKDTVRQAQDTLARMALHAYSEDIRRQARQLTEDGRYIAFLTGASRDYVHPPYPQSLGELCLEFRSDELSRRIVHDYEPMLEVARAYGFPTSSNADAYKYEFHAIRRTLYRRHTDPSIESLESARDYFQQLQIEAAQEYLDKPTLYEQTRQKAYAPKD